MAGTEWFDPKMPHIGYSGRDQDKPQGIQVGNSETIRKLGELMGGDQGFENTQDAVIREYGSSVSIAGVAARVSTLEAQISVDATFSDNFNRGYDASSLGSQKPGSIAPWIQFGDGQALVIENDAAVLSRDALFNLMDDGTQYALSPVPAGGNDFAVIGIVNPRQERLSTRARTTLYGRCNASGTEGIYADFYGDRCAVGKFTRSGLTMNRTQWKPRTDRSLGQASTFELQMDDNLYRLVVDGEVLVDHIDTTGFPIDGNHRFGMFSEMCWTPGLGSLAPAEFSVGVTGFAIRSIDMSAVQKATIAAQQAQETADNAVDTAVDAAVGAAAGAVQGAVDGAIAPVKNQVEAVQASVITFQEGLPLRPFSHSMTNSEMTFDRVLLQPKVTDVGISGSVSSTGLGSHNHTIPSSGSTTGTRDIGSHSHNDTFAASVSVSNSTFVPAANAITAGFIRATWGGLRESFTFATGPVTSPCPMQVIVGRLNPTDGNIAILWVSANLTATIGSGSGEFVVTIPDGVLLEDRETIFVGIHQYGTGGVRPLYGITLAGLQRDGLLYPAKPNTRFGRSTAMTAGTTITAASLDFSNDTLPWLGVGPSLVIPTPGPTSYYENFDGTTMPSSLVRRGGIAAKIEGGVFLPTGGDDGEVNYQYTKRLNRDDHAVESRLAGVNSRPSYLGLRSDSAGYNRVVMAVKEDQVSIQRRGSSATTLAAASMPVSAGTTFRFSAIGNVYTAARLESNGAATTLCQFVDSSNVLPRGVDNRYVTIGGDRYFFVVSGGWEFLRAADFPDAA